MQPTETLGELGAFILGAALGLVTGGLVCSSCTEEKYQDAAVSRGAARINTLSGKFEWTEPIKKREER